MAEWSTPIYDRTLEDVEYAIKQIAEWTKANIVNNPHIVHNLKGCLNVSDINRIEGNVAFLSAELTRLHYPPNTSSREWFNGELPNERDVQRILNNIRALITSFYQQKNAPPIPANLRGYEEANAVEENLKLIKELLDYMTDSFKKSGTRQAGKTFSLPIRR